MVVKSLTRSACAATLAGVVLLAGCATQVPLNDPVYQRLSKLQHEVNQLQKLVKGQQFMNVVSGQQQLEQRLADMQGQIQTLQHQLQQAQQRQQGVNRNFDRRLAVLEGGAPTGFPGTGPSGPQSGGPTGSGVSGPTGTGSAAPGAATRTSQPVSDSAAYRAAFAKLRAGDNDAAIAAFTRFIQQYPDSSYVPNAWYWMGETHYVNGEYQDAIANFRKVVGQYPDSAKAADSQLKIGYAQYAMGNFDQARATFETVIQRYPGTTPADLAQQRLRKMGSQG